MVKMKTWILVLSFGAFFGVIQAKASDVYCYSPLDSGPCNGYFPSWFYNSTTGRCEEFIYGGCQGNENRYQDEIECFLSCYNPEDDLCLKPKDPGPCRGSIPSFYYNPKTNECEKFYYGGCRGNNNRFEDKAKCEDTCRTPDEVTALCKLPKDPGPCKALIKRYYYNSETGKCEEFNYGGCKGNDNNFKNKDACEVSCVPENGGDDEEEVDVCELPKVIGPCKGAKLRYYFDKQTGKCEKFYYGGCSGNENNFVTLEKCEDVCPEVDPCLQPMDVGPCLAIFPRFYYNVETEKCESFTYGGCHGNSNNFKTEQACRHKCGC